ncbi:hypothetical protein BDZ91DRAFT_730755 [Kalaharituber pfeilii]|nr:hypothetical protein BDZ91DRAFT_730755 [Kalaharituber pfeilii]
MNYICNVVKCRKLNSSRALKDAKPKTASLKRGPLERKVSPGNSRSGKGRTDKLSQERYKRNPKEIETGKL